MSHYVPKDKQYFSKYKSKLLVDPPFLSNLKVVIDKDSLLVEVVVVLVVDAVVVVAVIVATVSEKYETISELIQ